jgi:hypothetical protein
MKGVIAFIIVLLIMSLGHAATVLVLKLPHAWHLPMAAVGVLAAVIIIYLTKYSTSPGRETFFGMLAGVLLWAALVEIGVHEGADAINITERKAMEFSLAILIPLLIYFVFNENLKCNLLVALRKALRTSKKDLPEIVVDYWGPRVAVKMFLMIWIGHLILFFGYDEDFFGPRGAFCKAVFILCLLGGSYLFYRLTKAQEMDYAFRYAMPTVVVLWSCVELLVKWKIFSEPWITLNPLFLAGVTIAFIAILFAIVRAERRRKAGPHL